MILNLIGSVSEDFPSYSYYSGKKIYDRNYPVSNAPTDQSAVTESN